MTDIDELMARDPTSLSSVDIDAIIEWHRVQRARRASGEKITKPKVDLSAIMGSAKAKITPTEPAIKRRSI